MIRIVVILIFLLTTVPAHSAWEWHQSAAPEAALRQPLPLLNPPDSSWWHLSGTITHPFGLTEITAGNLTGYFQSQTYYLRSELTHLGVSGYRETALAMLVGYRFRNISAGAGVRLGMMDIVPLPVRVRQAILLESGYSLPNKLQTAAVLELPIQSPSDPIALAQKMSVAARYQALPTAALFVGSETKSEQTNFGIGGEWTPISELTVRLGIDPARGWGGGLTVRYDIYCFSFASYLVAPVGWSTLWTVSAAPLPPEQPGYRYPVKGY